MPHRTPQSGTPPRLDRARILLLVIVPLIFLNACADESDPVSVSAEGLTRASASFTNACPITIAFLTDNVGPTLSVVAPDYNDEEDWRYHGSPYNCWTNLHSTVRGSRGPRRTAYHTYPFSSQQVYELQELSPVVESNLLGVTFDCAGCMFQRNVYFTSAPPNPGFVGYTHDVRAAYGLHEEDNVAAELMSSTPAICTLDRALSPATASFHAAGICTLGAQYSFFDPVWQSFRVMQPWEIDVQASDVTTQSVNPDDSGELGPVTLAFAQLDHPGVITVTTHTISEGGVQPPTNFSLGDPPTYYDITPSVGLSFTGSVLVCITYAEDQFQPGSDMFLLHWDGSGWDPLPMQHHDAASRTVCAHTFSFSPFAVAQMAVEDGNDTPGKRKAKSKGQE